MYAIFKKEVKSYFYSPIAYVLMGLFVLVVAIFFYLGNIKGQSADFNSTLSAITFILIIIIPILTMRILAEDRKNGTEVLLITSPLSLSNMVIGKYLALLLVFLVMTGLTLIFPLITLMLGTPPIAPIIGSYIGFILLGAAFISVGVFASSLTENQVISVLISFVSMLVIFFMDSLGNALGGWMSTVMNWLSLPSRYNEFTTGILNIGNIIYYLSFIAVFLFLTIRVIEKRRWSQG